MRSAPAPETMVGPTLLQLLAAGGAPGEMALDSLSPAGIKLAVYVGGEVVSPVSVSLKQPHGLLSLYIETELGG